MKIPADEKVLDQPDLDLLVGLDALYARIVDGDAGVKTKIKAAMTKAKASFAESTYGIAALRDGNDKGPVNVQQLHKLIGTTTGPNGQKFTLEQFLACVTIRVDPLEDFLPGNVIEGLRPTIKKPAPKLVPELRPGAVFKIDGAESELLKLIKKSITIAAA